MGMNCGYAASKPGILKIVTVVIGLIVWAWIFTYMASATFLKDEQTREMESFLIFTEVNCLKVSAAAEAEKSKRGDAISQEEAKSLAKLESPCPRKWFIHGTVSIVFFCFLGSIIALIALLLVELNKNGGFNTIDYIGHFVAGGLLIVSVILIICYVAMAYTKSPDCDQDGPNKYSDKQKAKCEELTTGHYQILGFMICGGLILVNGVLYIMIGIAVKKQKN